MLTIRTPQLQALGEQRAKQFEDAVLAHLQTRFPKKFSGMPDGVPRTYVQRNMARAARHDVRTADAIVTLLEFQCQFGEQFEDSPAGDAALDILNNPEFPGPIKIALLAECLNEATGGRPVLFA